MNDVLLKINPIKSPIESIACTPDSTTLAVGLAATENKTPTLALLDISSGEIIKVIEQSDNFNNSVWKLIIDQTGRYLIYLKQIYNGDNRYNLVSYNMETGEKSIIMDVENNDKYKGFIVTPDNKLSIGIDNKIQKWDIANKCIIEEINIIEEKNISDPRCYTSLSYSSDNKLIAIGGIRSEEILIYDIERKTITNRIGLKIRFPKKIYFTNNNKHLFIADYWQKGFFAWDFDKSEYYLSETYNEDMELISCFDIHNELSVIGMKTSVVRILKTMEGKTLFRDKLHSGRVNDVIITPDNSKIVSAGEDGQIIVRINPIA